MTRGVSPMLGTATLVLLAGCMPSLDTPEGRRAAYLDCARDQGLSVRGGTIQTGSVAELERLQACEAIPR